MIDHQGSEYSPLRDNNAPPFQIIRKWYYQSMSYHSRSLSQAVQNVRTVSEFLEFLNQPLSNLLPTGSSKRGIFFLGGAVFLKHTPFVSILI